MARLKPCPSRGSWWDGRGPGSELCLRSGDTVYGGSTRRAAALVTIKPGGVRELHWHPNASEWQFYLAGKGLMIGFMPPNQCRWRHK